jgi:hypothetical protein
MFNASEQGQQNEHSFSASSFRVAVIPTNRCLVLQIPLYVCGATHSDVSVSCHESGQRSLKSFEAQGGQCGENSPP